MFDLMNKFQSFGCISLLRQNLTQTVTVNSLITTLFDSRQEGTNVELNDQTNRFVAHHVDCSSMALPLLRLGAAQRPGGFVVIHCPTSLCIVKKQQKDNIGNKNVELVRE